MPEEFFRYLDAERTKRIRVDIPTERGQIIHFTEQLELLIDGQYLPVVRYDNAHGRPHRDELDWHARDIPKLKWWMPEGTDLKAAIRHAEHDLHDNADRYILRFLGRRPMR